MTLALSLCLISTMRITTSDSDSEAHRATISLPDVPTCEEELESRSCGTERGIGNQ